MSDIEIAEDQTAKYVLMKIGQTKRWPHRVKEWKAKHPSWRIYLRARWPTTDGEAAHDPGCICSNAEALLEESRTGPCHQLMEELVLIEVADLSVKQQNLCVESEASDTSADDGTDSNTTDFTPSTSDSLAGDLSTHPNVHGPLRPTCRDCA